LLLKEKQDAMVIAQPRRRVCERLLRARLGRRARRAPREPAQEASGNPAAHFTRCHAGRQRFCTSDRRAFFIPEQMEVLENLRWDQCGLLQLARDEREVTSQHRSVAGLPAEYAQAASREEASSHAGVPVAAGGLCFPKPDGSIALAGRRTAEACGSRLTKSFGKELHELPEDRIVILANSFDAPKLRAVPHLRYDGCAASSPTCGRRFEAPRVVVLRGGMVLRRWTARAWSARASTSTTRPAPRARAMRQPRAAGAHRAFATELRICKAVAFRSVTPDRLPWSARSAKRLWRFAYGSRGLVWARSR